MSKKREARARLAPGFRDIASGQVAARNAMIETLCGVYARYGFERLETPAIEYVDVLGKNLPESDEPAGGVFALQDDDDQWISLRYDLTAPLARVFAQNAQNLPRPYRRYQTGPVWRREKPGPGRFREFYQCDFDTVGTSAPAADAEVCAVLCDGLEALGIGAGQYQVRVNNRKILDGVLEVAGIEQQDGTRLTVLRAIDKLERLGMDGVRDLLTGGRKDKSGDFTKGAGLEGAAVDRIIAYMNTAGATRGAVCDALDALVGESEAGRTGVAELREIDALLGAMDYAEDRVIFDPSVVRGLAYYTGPVFEAVLTADIRDAKGRKRDIGSVAGGGRYDDLVTRFTGQQVPATGASIGVDRLLTALELLGADKGAPAGPVVVTVMDRDRLVDYQRLANSIRAAGITAELYLGTSGFRAQMKYADRRRSPVVVIQGSDEFEAGTVTLKDMQLGAKLSSEIDDRDEWRKGQPAQCTVPEDQMLGEIRRMLGLEDT
ncbi:MAG: histidine--tRNA ligase [Pseudomonadota bacterium]